MKTENPFLTEAIKLVSAFTKCQQLALNIVFDTKRQEPRETGKPPVLAIKLNKVS